MNMCCLLGNSSWVCAFEKPPLALGRQIRLRLGGQKTRFRSFWVAKLHKPAEIGRVSARAVLLGWKPCRSLPLWKLKVFIYYFYYYFYWEIGWLRTQLPCPPARCALSPWHRVFRRFLHQSLLSVIPHDMSCKRPSDELRECVRSSHFNTSYCNNELFLSFQGMPPARDGPQV